MNTKILADQSNIVYCSVITQMEQLNDIQKN